MARATIRLAHAGLFVASCSGRVCGKIDAHFLHAAIVEIAEASSVKIPPSSTIFLAGWP
jgi:hypothetical protein